MAIVDNISTEEGDVLVIKTEVPIVGIISLLDFVDTTQGETISDYFYKEFRYSINGGITYSSWMELTTLNISNISVTQQSQFVLEYRYTRIGGTESVDLEFDNISLSGDIENISYPVFDSTFLSDFIAPDNVEIYGWALNVLEKLYEHGILGEYVIRGEESSNIFEDQDFLVFWNSVTHYFAIIVNYARQYRDISTNPRLIEEFLKNKDIEIGNATSEELLSIYNYYVSEYEKRGTSQVIENGGEFKRLIGFESPEEFIFALLQSHETGWCIGKSSPCWNNTEFIQNVIKGYEYTREVLDLSKYPLSGESYISIVGDDMVISGTPISTICGINYTNQTDKLLEVNKNLDYEISFYCKMTDITDKVTFGVRLYNEDMSSSTPINLVSGYPNSSFVVKQSLPIANQMYWIRGILYNQNREVDEDETMFPNGQYLKFNPDHNVKYLVPTILVDTSTSALNGDIHLYDIKIRPLKTPFTLGQLGVKNIILAYLKNNNKEYTTTKLEYEASSKLLPANTFLKIKYL